MRQLLSPGLLWFSTIGCGLIAGVYFAFSSFVMASLARLSPEAGIAAMNAINVEIVKSAFMPLFLATMLAAVALGVIGAMTLSAPGAPAMLAGGMIYALGMLGVTMMWNVPLNDALAASGGGSEAAALWTRYLGEWVMWNHVRTVASGLACGLFCYALTVR